MAAVELLETKLRVASRRRGVVGRPRLTTRLAPAALPALTLVSAPAGFGKTTLLAEWLASTDARTAWLSLDARDNDERLFWSYVVAATRRAVDGVGACAELIDEGAPFDAVVTALLNELGRIEDDVVVLLDDYHQIESPTVHESVRFLVENLPAHAHLVLATRADPPWPLAGLRARGELLELRADDLRFTSEEAAAYLDGEMGLGLGADAVATLERRTEGWIAALQLAALSIHGRADPAAFIAEFAGDDRFIVDYLADEVLDRQPDDVRTFLLRTSILSRLTGALCDAVTATAGGKATLDALERANLFLVPLDDRRVWYRYHHLFADVLAARLADDDPAVIDVLHHRASEWYGANGDSAEATRHALAGHDFARAAELIELTAPDLRRARQELTLRGWLESLPSDVLAERPVLNLALVGARLATGVLSGVEPILDHVADQLAAGSASPVPVVVVDEAEVARLPAQVSMYRAAAALLGGDATATIVHAQRVLDLTAAGDHVGHGAASALVGLAQWTLGDLAAAEANYATAVDAFVAADHHADVLGCARALADIQVARGRLDAATRTLEAGLERARRHGPLRGTADMHAGLSDLARERNDLDGARSHAEASARLGDHEALPPNAFRWRVAMAELLRIDGDHDGALDLLRDAADVYDTDFSPSIRPIPAVLARHALARGDLAAARRWVAERAITADEDPVYLTEYEHVTLARVLLAEHAAGSDERSLDTASALLDRLHGEAVVGGRGSVVEISALRALACQRAGDRSTAIALIGEALAAADEHGYVRVFLDDAPAMTELVEQAARRGDRTAQRVLGARRDSPTVGRTARAGGPAEPLVEPLSSRERDVLRLLRSELSGPEIAREMMVSLNTVRTHTKSIYLKLGVNSRRSAVRRATELGL